MHANGARPKVTTPLNDRDLRMALEKRPTDVVEQSVIRHGWRAFDGDAPTVAFNLVQAATAKTKLNEIRCRSQKEQLDTLSRQRVNNVFSGTSREHSAFELLNAVVARGALQKLVATVRLMSASKSSGAP